ncbi:hypothetical protein ACET3Z_002966 [Daucus carota]
MSNLRIQGWKNIFAIGNITDRKEQDYVAGLALFHLSRCQAQSSWFCTLMELTEGIGLIVWASVREDVLR